MMTTTRTLRGSYTYADYLRTPEGERYELVDGELMMAPAPVPLHQSVSLNLAVLLWSFVRDNGLGEVFAAPIDVYLSDTNVVQPDLALVTAARVGIITETNIRGAPDLVIEVLSPSTEVYDRTVKRELYERFGVREYWLAHPTERTVERLRMEDGRLVEVGRYGVGDWLSTPLLEGLWIELGQVF